MSDHQKITKENFKKVPKPKKVTGRGITRPIDSPIRNRGQSPGPFLDGCGTVVVFVIVTVALIGSLI